MKPTACTEFREELAARLAGRRPELLATLSWKAHLASCSGCRELLEAEEALESLLESLPEPSLPPELARRVLARLRASGVGASDRLDDLLSLDAAPTVPAGLADRVLAGLKKSGQSVEEVALDRLLEAVPEPVVPPGLPRRVLTGLGLLRPARSAKRRVAAPILALAALLLCGFFLWFLMRDRAEDAGGDEAQFLARENLRNESAAPEGSPSSAVAEEDLLAALPLLERWDELALGDLDLLLSALDPMEEAALEIGQGDEAESGDDDGGNLEQPAEGARRGSRG